MGHIKNPMHVVRVIIREREALTYYSQCIIDAAQMFSDKTYLTWTISVILGSLL